MQVTPIDETRQAASEYIAAGLFPIQLAPPDAPKKADGGWCKSPGKQPISNSWQKRDKPEDPSLYRPGCNLGLRTGMQPIGVFLVCLDVDCPDVAELEKLAPGSDWPATLVARSGRNGGGYHFLYSWPSGLPYPRNGVKLSGTLIDIRSEGGQFVVAPSTHPDSGLQYTWITDSDIAELPVGIAENILSIQNEIKVSGTGARPNASVVSATSSVAASSETDLFDISASRFKTLLRRLSNRNSNTALAFENMLHNRPIAESGHRDDTITRMCFALAQEVPNANPDSIAKHFEESLSLLAAISPFSAPCDVSAKFRSACAKLSQAIPEVQLLTSQNGNPVTCIHNVMQVMRFDKSITGRFAYNKFSECVVINRPLPWDKDQDPNHYPRSFCDEDTTHLAQYLMQHHRLNASTSMIFESLKAVSRDNEFHPVQEYLLDLHWDGVPRLSSWLQQVTGCIDSDYTRKIFKWWMMSAVMRVASPGCQADYCLILEGPQGAGKSQLLKALAGRDWFTDECSDFASKDASIDIAGKWIIELAELATVQGAKDQNVVKRFVTRSIDRHRPPFGRVSIDIPRQCVFAGTTNDSEYLIDTTGNRRFWPVAIGVEEIDIEQVRADRDQLWAEAAYRVSTGEVYWPSTKAERDAFEAEVESRRIVDSLEDKITAWLEDPVGYSGQRLSTAWFFENVLCLEQPKRSDDARLNAILRRLGWERKAGSGGRYWKPPDSWAPKLTVAPVLELMKKRPA